MRAPGGHSATISRGTSEPAIEAHRAARDQIRAAHGDQIRRAGPGADEMDGHDEILADGGGGGGGAIGRDQRGHDQPRAVAGGGERRGFADAADSAMLFDRARSGWRSSHRRAACASAVMRVDRQPAVAQRPRSSAGCARLVVGHGDGARPCAPACATRGVDALRRSRPRRRSLRNPSPITSRLICTTLHCTTGIAARQPVRPPTAAARSTDKPQQRAAMARLPRDQFGLGLQRHRIDHQPSARRQRLPDRIEHAVAAGAAADEHHVRRRQILQRLGRAARVADRDAARRAHRALARALASRSARGSMPIARLVRMRQQPFDADRAGAGADVPQQFAAARRQRRQRHRADLALGQLAVVAEQLIGQAGDAREG